MSKPVDALREAIACKTNRRRVVIDFETANALLRLVEDGERYLEAIREAAGVGVVPATCVGLNRCALTVRLLRECDRAYHRRKHAEE